MAEPDPEFIAEMAKELESSIRKLELREKELKSLLGAERVEELRALWAKELEAEDEDELKRNVDWDDKELIWVWSRLERAREKRVLVGRTSMVSQKLGKDVDKDAKD